VLKECRVCGSNAVSDGFTFQPYNDFVTTVHDCDQCGCRFTNRDEHTYESLHSEESTYSAHRELQSIASVFFENGDIAGLENYLKVTSKNQYVIEEIKSNPSYKKILEFGCSRGYLSSFSILLEKEFYGVDVSKTAIEDASKAFGNHFYTPDHLCEFQESYFDLIYHVGTVGCVDDPVKFIADQIKLLRPGGSLIFNAPNLDACKMLDLPWLTGTTPPDLVTLFPPGFWSREFSDIANVSIDVQKDSPLISYIRRKRSLTVWKGPKQNLYSKASDKKELSWLRRLASRGARQLGKYLPPLGMLSPLPQEFGVFVKITKKHSDKES
jgi:SAM-dependent methyltransferase